MAEPRKAWIRWLSARGVPPGRIARVLDCDPADVAEALRTRCGRTRYDVDPARIAELRAAGGTWQSIGDALGISCGLAHYLHNRKSAWRPKVPARPPGAGSPRKVRRLAELGYEPIRVAELLGVEAGRVVALLARPGPRPSCPREWGWSRGPEYRDEPAPPPAVAEAPSPAPGPMVAIARAVPAEGWGPMAMAGGQPGRRSNHTALTDADAELVRALRAGGVPRKDLAERFDVSVATITRITRGETYRPVEREPDRVVVIEPPAIAAAEGPAPTVWAEPRRPGRRPPPEHRDD
jgi:hypothetical protein